MEAIQGDEVERRLREIDSGEKAWADEIRRRVSDYRSGKARTRPIDEVLDEVDEMIRRGG